MNEVKVYQTWVDLPKWDFETGDRTLVRESIDRWLNQDVRGKWVKNHSTKIWFIESMSYVGFSRINVDVYALLDSKSYVFYRLKYE